MLDIYVCSHVNNVYVLYIYRYLLLTHAYRIKNHGDYCDYECHQFSDNDLCSLVRLRHLTDQCRFRWIHQLVWPHMWRLFVDRLQQFCHSTFLQWVVVVPLASLRSVERQDLDRNQRPNRMLCFHVETYLSQNFLVLDLIGRLILFCFFFRF